MAVYISGRGFKLRTHRVQIQQVARVGLEPGTAELQVRLADYLATLPPHYKLIRPPAFCFSFFFSFLLNSLFSRNSTTARAKHSREGEGEHGATLTPSAASFASSEFPAVLIFVRALDYP